MQCICVFVCVHVCFCECTSYIHAGKEEGCKAEFVHDIIPGSYKTFFMDVLLGVSFSFLERSWMSSINANELVLLSGSGSISIVGFDVLFCESLTISYT